MKKLLLITFLFCFWACVAWSQQITTVKVPPSNDTTVVKLTTTTTTTANTMTSYTMSTVPGPVHDTVVTPPPPVVVPGYTLTYSNAFDKKEDISSNQLGRGGFSTDVVKSGAGSFRSEVRAGDPPISSGYRSEQQYEGGGENPTEGAVEYDVYYEKASGGAWSGFDGGGHSVQWHPNTPGGSAIISLQNYGGKFNVVRDPKGSVIAQSGTLKTCQSNTWYHLRWEFKWSTGSDGYCRLYIDGSLYFSFNGQTADGSGQYFKLGQNRWPASGNTMKSTSVCYYDNLLIYKKS